MAQQIFFYPELERYNPFSARHRGSFEVIKGRAWEIHKDTLEMLEEAESEMRSKHAEAKYELRAKHIEARSELILEQMEEFEWWFDNHGNAWDNQPWIKEEEPTPKKLALTPRPDAPPMGPGHCCIGGHPFCPPRPPCPVIGMVAQVSYSCDPCFPRIGCPMGKCVLR